MAVAEQGNLEHAYGYAGLGLEIFPVNPADKTPLISQLKATTDLDQLEAWWQRWPRALIGHRLSAHHIILDIDPRHGGKQTWAALRAEMPEITTRAHFSGRDDGGGHVWFQRPGDKVTITKLDAWAKDHDVGSEVGGRWTCGIDILRHEHRYTILPPSQHPETHKPYHWAQGRGLSIEPAAMPQMLVDLITRDDLPTVAQIGPQWRDPDSIADWYSSETPWASLLPPKGWVLVGGDGEADGSRWRHPEATNPFSATITHGCLFVHSSNTAFEQTAAGEPHGYTPFRAFATLEHSGDLKEAGRAARALKGGSSNRTTATNGQHPSERTLGVTWADGIELRRVRWCWDGRLALGTLGLLAGPEGLGKSTLACSIGASLTKGTLPGEYAGRPRNVLVCATEDSWNHTIAPRFLAAGADMKRVGKVEARIGDLAVGLSLPDDLEALERLAIELEPALLILDPLISRLSGKLDSHRDGEVRQALEPLILVADVTGMAIMGLIHHNKSGKSDPLELVMASKAFTAVARSVHTVIKDPDDETGLQRYFGTPKNNLGSIDLPLLSFTIEPFVYATADGDGATGKVAWGAERQESISDVIGRGLQDPEQRTASQEAADWLADHLQAHGPKVASKDAKWAGKTAGHSERTIKRAAKTIGVIVSSEGFPRQTYWSVSEAQLAPSQKVGPTGPTGSDQGEVRPISPVGPKECLPTREGPTARDSIDPETDSLDSDLYGPDGSPWCRFGKGSFTCLNGDRCRNHSQAAAP